MTSSELGKLFPIFLVKYDHKWSVLYQKEKRILCGLFEESEIKSIEHIGSTAIPGIKAKPIIDILVQVAEDVPDEKIIAKIKLAGYIYIFRPENPPPHMMFVKGYTVNGFVGQAYHVHVRYKGDWDEIFFRDYLISNPEVAKEYEILKMELAIKYKNDREAYTEAKSGFINSILENRKLEKTNK
ncbi:MAG: GrpB family protein [Prolixibacteraceae bacterium]|nr:GrpB family protein [Prolixibacteraceae bacterium]MBN2774812.1 GrpB family protein [Prolixibacteraceae bacterium]